MSYCTACGAQIPENATACAACGRPIAGAVSAQAAAGTINDNVAGMLAYFTIIPAIIFLLIEPLNRKPFVRFHSFQSIFFVVALVMIHLGIGIISHIIPFLFLLFLPLQAIVSLGAFIVWIVLVIKAYQGQMFRLPIIGDMAANQAGI
ncbi:MAG TPA: zinc-ribbon domain-containing protein [Terriglobales bacterium]